MGYDMKTFIIGLILLMLSVVSGMAAEDSGQMWLIKFKPGHSIIEQLHPDSLAKLDVIMRDIPANSVIWFYGSASDMFWKGHNEHFSQALDGGKRIDRALELSKRYSYRNINISATHENVTGVKVVWYQETTIINNDTTIVNNHYQLAEQKNENNIKIPIGLSVWIFGDDIFVNPYLGVLVRRDLWAFGGKIGAIPFTFENNVSNSFVAGSVQRMFNEKYGVSADLLVTWEYLTTTDTWTKKSAGLSVGFVARKDRLEVNPSVIVVNQVLYDQPNSSWYAGANIIMSFYVK